MMVSRTVTCGGVHIGSDRVQDRGIRADAALARSVQAPRRDWADRIWLRSVIHLLIRFDRWQGDLAARARLRALAEEPDVLRDVGMSRADALRESRR